MPRLERGIRVVVVLALCFAALEAVRNVWVCDDAFISFRYAKNLVDGHGLVFNAGERVEGYTNFLWTMLVAAGMTAGVDPVVFGHVVGILFHLATIVLLLRSTAVAVPVAAVALALHHHSAEFASCGLETAMFTFLVTVGLMRLIAATAAKDHVLASLALVLATMTRPDGVLFVVVAAALVLWLSIRQQRWELLVAFTLPLLLIYLPYFVWRVTYYGDLLPNTFYAKAANEPRLDQGLTYVSLYFLHYPAVVVGLVFWGMLAWQRRAADIVQGGWDGMRSPVLLLGAGLLWLAYVAWVGGDFMFGRFVLPVTPVLLLGLQEFLRGRRLAWNLGLGAAVLVAGSVPYLTARMIESYMQRYRVTDEHGSYPAWLMQAQREIVEQLRLQVGGARVCFAIGGGEAVQAYYGEFAEVIEMHGLTDRFIARRPIEGVRVKQPGHEKRLPYTDPYLCKERKVHLINGTVFMAFRLGHDRVGHHRQFEFHVDDIPYPDPRRVDDNGNPIPPKKLRFTGWLKLTLLTYQRELMDQLKTRTGVRFEPFDEFLDRYIASLDTRPRQEVEADYQAFRAFYFDVNYDPERELAFEKYLGRKGR
ncbi:MAG: hypothetical protein ACYS5W_06495 [Planctomycetota bacterium]|jgi:hypothetical protein